MEDYISQIIFTASTKFGITSVKPYQLLVMQRILEQQDLEIVRNQVVILPTGTGKSLCFQIPAMLCRKKTIIIYPLLALMADQKKRMDKAGITSIVIKGGQTKSQRQELFATDAKVVITNPETLCMPHIMKELKKYKYELFVIDEAHIIKQWGNEFRPMYSKLRVPIDTLKPHQLLAFTATASEETLKTIETSIFKEKPLVIRGDADRENIFYGAIKAPNKLIGLLQALKKCSRPAIVFCGERKNCEILCLKSRQNFNNIPARYYHAGLSKEERTSIEDWFMTSTDGILFTTCAYGMGIDKSNIRTVIHYALPSSSEEYLQESGRAGRDGEFANAWVLISQDHIAENQLTKTFTQNICRRKALLESLGQQKEDCSGCDICNGIINNLDFVSNQILKLIRHYPLRYTPHSAAALLCGIKILWKMEKDSQFHPMYGILDNYSFEEVLSAIESDKHIKQTKHNRLYLTKIHPKSKND